MSSYSEFKASSNNICPIMYEKPKWSLDQHPFRFITIDGKPYFTEQIKKWIDKNYRPKNPLTNLPLKSGDISRINYYYKKLIQYPELTREILRGYIHQLGTKDTDEKNYEMICQCSHAEDFDGVKFSDRKEAENVLTKKMENGKSDFLWLIRKCSILYESEDNVYCFAISFISNGEINHYAYRHNYGYGYYNLYGSNSNTNHKNFNAKFIGNTLGCIFKKNVNFNMKNIIINI